MGSESPTSSRPFSEALAVILTLLVTFLTYMRTIRFGFVYDDIDQIVRNPFLRLPHYIKLSFTAQVWAYYYPHAPGGYYRPLFMMWLLLNRMAFGLHAPLWHLANIFLCLAVTGMAYLVVKELVGDPITAWIAALIFGLHPVHIESVAWVSGCTDPLAALWTFIAFWSFMKWRKRSAAGWLALSLASYAAAILFKETALIFPIILLAYEWIWEDVEGESNWVRRWFKRLLYWFRRLEGYALVTAAYFAARWHALGGIASRTNQMTFRQVLLTWPSILTLAAKHLVWPFGVSEFYGHMIVYAPGLLNFFLPLAIFCLIVASLVIWIRCTRRHSPQEAKLMVFGCVWLIAPLAPLADLAALPISEDIFHDRYLYMSVLGLGLLVGLALRHIKRGSPAFGIPALQMVAVCVIAATLGIASSIQGDYWQNSFLLFSRGVSGTPSRTTLANFATSLVARGDYAKAIALYQKALAGHQNDWTYPAERMRVDLASTYAMSGHNDQAIGLLEYVLDHDPKNWSALYNLGLTEYRVNNFPAALKYLQRAIARNKLHGAEYFYLGLTDLKLNRALDAENNFARAVALDPHHFAYHLALGQAYSLEGKRKLAVAQYKEELVNYPSEMAARQLLQAAEDAEQSRPPAEQKSVNQK